jgi:hypothetical protein
MMGRALTERARHTPFVQMPAVCASVSTSVGRRQAAATCRLTGAWKSPSRTPRLLSVRTTSAAASSSALLTMAELTAWLQALPCITSSSHAAPCSDASDMSVALK